MADTSYSKLLDRIKDKSSKIAIIGIGRVGLPLALSFANSGFDTVGIDNNEEMIKTINQGIAPFHEDGMQEILTNNIDDKKLKWFQKKAAFL